jgi:uncharacterized membrane protein
VRLGEQLPPQQEFKMDIIEANPARMDSLRKVVLFDYALHIVGAIFTLGSLSVIALIINYVKRDSARGTLYESHMNWMIRTFWWTLFWIVVSFIPAVILTVITFGLMSWLFVVPVIWFLYRMIKGVLWLQDDKAMPA